MTDAEPTETAARKTHPIRGALWGLLTGLGLAIVLIVTRVVTIGWVPLILSLLIGTAVSLVWSLFGPAKQPKLQS